LIAGALIIAGKYNKQYYTAQQEKQIV
jgi:hypothetical protein